MNKMLAAIAIASSVAAGASDCGGGTKSTEIVRDVWQPGSYSPRLCVNNTHWLVKIERADGSAGARCVEATVGKRQRIGSPFRP